MKLQIKSIDCDMCGHYTIKARINNNVYTYTLGASTYLKLIELYRQEDYAKCVKLLEAYSKVDTT